MKLIPEDTRDLLQYLVSTTEIEGKADFYDEIVNIVIYNEKLGKSIIQL